MNANALLRALHDGTRVYGTLIVSDSPFWPTVVAGIRGLDCVFIDTEHVAIARDRVSWMCRTYAAMGLPPIVRIPSPDPYSAAMVLDGGACGVIAPYVETVEEATALVGAVKKRPLKGGKLKEALLNGSTDSQELDGYLQRYNDQHVLVINVESVPAVENLDALLSVPGLDAILVGPHDLSCSMGRPERYEDRRFVEMVDHILQKARSVGLGAGIHYVFPHLGLEQEIAWVESGANLVIHSADAIAAQSTLDREIRRIRDAVGDPPVTSREPGSSEFHPAP